MTTETSLLKMPLIAQTAVRPASKALGDIAGVPRRISPVLAVLDLMALTLAAAFASVITAAIQHTIFHGDAFSDVEGAVELRRNVYSVLSVVALAMFWNKGFYSKRLPWWSLVQYTGKVMFFLFMMDGFLSFGLKLYESRLLIASNWALAFGLIISFRWFFFRTAGRMGLWRIPTVLIGNNAVVSDLMYAFSTDPCAGYDVHTILLRDREEFDTSSLPHHCGHIQVRDGMSEYEGYIQHNPNSFYVVALDAFRGETREQLLVALENAGAPYAIVPATSRMGLYDMEPRYFFGHDVMMLQPRQQNAGASSYSASRVAKRVLDIAVAGSALLVLSPLMGAVALMLKLEGQGGTLFYGGRRIGHQGDFFSCWKFRSMEPDSDHLLQARLAADPAAQAAWDKYRKLPDDPRVTTRTARFIRKASIDELPQLWNVLIGDMSLVGPRPILEDEQGYFGDALKDYLSVRPGLTGLWQVSGRNATSFMRRVRWDSWYVRNWSLWGDIVILIKTPFVLLSRHGAH